MLQEKNQNLSVIASNFQFLQAKLTFLKGYQKKDKNCSEALVLADHEGETKINVFEPEVVVKKEPQFIVKNDVEVEDELKSENEVALKNKAEDNALKNMAEDNIVKNKAEDELIVKELPEVALKKGPQAQLVNKAKFVMGFSGIKRLIVFEQRPISGDTINLKCAKVPNPNLHYKVY